jgi:Family of unknown function (DUF6502)
VQVTEKKQRSTVAASRMDLRIAAKQALQQVLKLLTEFVIDTGLSTREIHTILRESAVRIIADRQLQVAKRVNISGISASTGIPRSEISRIIKARSQPGRHSNDRRQQSTNRILAAWHNEPKYKNANGQPTELRLYGRGITFESLVKAHGRGIPTRAVLDELVRTRAVDVLPSQRIRARTSLTIHRRLNRQFIKMFGDRVSELICTLLTNMKEPSTAEFFASVSGTVGSMESLPLVRREIAAKGAEFLSEIRDSFVHHRANGVKTGRSMSVIVFCHEGGIDDRAAVAKEDAGRQNFRRPSKVTSRH